MKFHQTSLFSVIAVAAACVCVQAQVRDKAASRMEQNIRRAAMDEEQVKRYLKWYDGGADVITKHEQ
jgi:hypothetical protein